MSDVISETWAVEDEDERQQEIAKSSAISISSSSSSTTPHSLSFVNYSNSPSNSNSNSSLANSSINEAISNHSTLLNPSNLMPPSSGNIQLNDNQRDIENPLDSIQTQGLDFDYADEDGGSFMQKAGLRKNNMEKPQSKVDVQIVDDVREVQEKDFPTFSSEDVASFDVQELLSDMEKLISKIKENSRNESKSTTLFGLGRFFIKLATGNPISAVVDAALTKKAAEQVGKRTNTLTEMEFLVSSLEQFLQTRFRNENGKLIGDSSRFMTLYRDDIASLLAIGASPRVIAKLMGVEEEVLIAKIQENPPPPPELTTNNNKNGSPKKNNKRENYEEEEEEEEVPLQNTSKSQDDSGEWVESIDEDQNHTSANNNNDKDDFTLEEPEGNGIKKDGDMIIYDSDSSSNSVSSSGQNNIGICLPSARVDEEAKRILKQFRPQLEELFRKEVSANTISVILGTRLATVDKLRKMMEFS